MQHILFCFRLFVTLPLRNKSSLATIMVLEVIDKTFSVCKVSDYADIDRCSEFVFTGATDEELSLVCPVEQVPANTIERSDGWKAFRIQGILDFSLIGILSKISTLLADNGIGIFAISTFNTDYIFVQQKDFAKALEVLRQADI